MKLYPRELTVSRSSCQPWLQVAEAYTVLNNWCQHCAAHIWTRCPPPRCWLLPTSAQAWMRPHPLPCHLRASREAGQNNAKRTGCPASGGTEAESETITKQWDGRFLYCKGHWAAALEAVYDAFEWRKEIPGERWAQTPTSFKFDYCFIITNLKNCL